VPVERTRKNKEDRRDTDFLGRARTAQPKERHWGVSVLAPGEDAHRQRTRREQGTLIFLEERERRNRNARDLGVSVLAPGEDAHRQMRGINSTR
jgi:hypothetical protein